MRQTLSMPSYLVPSLAILAFALFLIFALSRLFMFEQTMRDNVDENMLWVVTQAQIASHRFDQALNRQAAGETDFDAELRLDILSSRLSLMNEGPQRRYLITHGLESQLDETLSGLKKLQLWMDSHTHEQALQPKPVLTQIDMIMNHLNRIANDVMFAEWESTGIRLDTYRNNLIQVIGSVAGISISGLILVMLLMQALRKRSEAQQALIAHRDQLEHKVSKRTQALDAERRRVVTAINTAPDGFAAFDANGLLFLTNPMLAELLPLDWSSLRGSQYLTVVIDAIEKLGQTEPSFISEQATWTGQYELQLTNLQWRQLMLLHTEDGGCILRVSDITRYKVAEHKLSQALEIERGVSDFYRSFASMVSHQFRTPMAVIDSGLQRLQRRNNDYSSEQRSERYQRLRNAVAHMTRLISCSLTMARIDGNQVKTVVAHHSVHRMVLQICHFLEENEQADRLQPQQLTADTSAYCDPALTEQILSNLITNALKYAPPNSPVCISTERREHQIVCQVRDHGPGIPKQEQQKIFDRFFRGCNSAGTEGIGLGLNIAMHLARIQKGTIEVQSEAGQGTTFTLYLPINRRQRKASDGNTISLTSSTGDLMR